jgi:hypothetical protein
VSTHRADISTCIIPSSSNGLEGGHLSIASIVTLFPTLITKTMSYLMKIALMTS